MPSALATDGSALYWIDIMDWTVRRAAIGAPPCDDATCETLATIQNGAEIAVDGVAVYWTVRSIDGQTPKSGRIMKVGK